MPVMSIEDSKTHLTSSGLIIIEDRHFQILDEAACIWFAYAQHDRTAMSFPIIVRGDSYIELTSEAVYNFVAHEYE